MKIQIKEYQNEISILKSKYDDEHKELILVKEELNKLKISERLKVENYLNWNGDDIVDWLMILDKLRKVFNCHKVNGEKMFYIDKQELRGWGVSDLMHRNNIFNHFQTLTQPNSGNEIEQEGTGNIITKYIRSSLTLDLMVSPG